MPVDLNSDAQTASDEREKPTKSLDETHGSNSESEKFKYPGCFKKSIAFIIDQVIIVIVGIIIFLPLSDFIGAMRQYAWLPGYLIGALYFSVLESSLYKGQSIGKMVFSIKIVNISGELISPLASFGRYFLITLPLLNNEISNTIATTIGITNSYIGGTIFLAVVGILFSGNTLFMLFHPQKRGLHDIIFRTVVIPAKYKPIHPIRNLMIMPVTSGIIGLAILAILFSNLFTRIDNNPDIADLNNLTNKIIKETAMDNISVAYTSYSLNGKQTAFSIDVHIPVPYEKFDDADFINNISNDLYQTVKRINTNPKVDTITMIFHAQKYYGLFPFTKTSKHPKRIEEIDLSGTTEQKV